MMTLNDVAGAVDGELQLERNTVANATLTMTGVSIDSRAISTGDLYVAIKGERFDGHDFAAEAIDKGACCVLVEPGKTDVIPRIESGDTTFALGRLAATWRQSLSMPVVAVTGSNGKTTVKQMIASILSAAGLTGAVTQGNLNNHLGLPLSVLKLRTDSQFGVFEMGMNHPGEIDYLTRIAQPNVALVNNAAAAHLEGVGDVQAVARAKGEIFSGLQPAGTAVINADDEFADYWRSLVSDSRVISFGVNAAADVQGTSETSPRGSNVSIRTAAGTVDVMINVPGRHNVLNALAATAVALGLGISLEAIGRGLESFTSVDGRLAFSKTIGGARVINDTYNANPESVAAALDVLASQPGQRVFVMGDMAELGEGSVEYHGDVLNKAEALSIDVVLTLGVQFKQKMQDRSRPMTYTGYTDIDDLVAACRSLDTSGTNFLVKGSRSMQMERVVRALTKPVVEQAATSDQTTYVSSMHSGQKSNATC